MQQKRAADIMTREVHTLRETETIRVLLERMRADLLSGVPIVDATGRAIGLISQNDVARSLALAAGIGHGEERLSAGDVVDDALAQPELARHLGRPVKDIMTPVVWSCRPEATLKEVCDMMVQRRIHRVVVCDADRRVVGMVSALDIVRLVRDELGDA